MLQPVNLRDLPATAPRLPAPAPPPLVEQLLPGRAVDPRDSSVGAPPTRGETTASTAATTSTTPADSGGEPALLPGLMGPREGSPTPSFFSFPSLSSESRLSRASWPSLSEFLQQQSDQPPGAAGTRSPRGLSASQRGSSASSSRVQGSSPACSVPPVGSLPDLGHLSELESDTSWEYISLESAGSMPSVPSESSVSADAVETAEGRLRTISPTALRELGCLASDLVGALPDPAPALEEPRAPPAPPAAQSGNPDEPTEQNEDDRDTSSDEDDPDQDDDEVESPLSFVRSPTSVP